MVSEGLSRTQRAILVALRENFDGLTAAQLAEHIWDRLALDTPSPTQRETIRRALLNLERRGLADVFYIGAENVSGEIRRRVAASITAAGFDLADQLSRRVSRV